MLHYDKAFCRNIGWITEQEQQALRGKRVAIAGMGGVGGVHLLTLARLGIGAFHIADFDRFELPNFNRQVGAFTDTVGKEKIAVMADMARRINPEADICIFPEGINKNNLEQFLQGVDLFVDGFDFFVLDARAKVFDRCSELGIPAMTVGPVGMSAAYLIFMPGHMTFEEYFRLSGLPREEQYVRWALGLAPAGIHRGYIMDPSRFDLANQRVPSIGASCMLCAGVAGIEALKLLLGRGKIYPAPYYHQLDVYKEKFVRGKLRGGSRNFLQRIKIHFASGLIKKSAQNARPEDLPLADTPLMRILDMARWTPSGENRQMWRFRILSNHHFIIESDSGYDAIYEYDNGKPTLLTTGMLLETIRLAAADERMSMSWKLESFADRKLRILVSLQEDSGIAKDKLTPYIRVRCTDRGRYRAALLPETTKTVLSTTLGGDLEIIWYEGWRTKLAASTINASAANIRFRIKENFAAHGKIFDFKQAYPIDKVPILSLPSLPPSRAFMRWALAKWGRLNLVTNYLGGMILPALETDIIPGLFSGAHFIIKAKRLPQSPDDIIRSGMRIQNFQLQAAKLGLALQPTYGPIVFAWHGRKKMPLTANRRMQAKAERLSKQFFRVHGCGAGDALYAGRIGFPARPVTSRSLRKPLQTLLME